MANTTLPSHYCFIPQRPPTVHDDSASLGLATPARSWRAPLCLRLSHGRGSPDRLNLSGPGPPLRKAPASSHRRDSPPSQRAPGQAAAGKVRSGRGSLATAEGRPPHSAQKSNLSPGWSAAAGLAAMRREWEPRGPAHLAGARCPGAFGRPWPLSLPRGVAAWVCPGPASRTARAGGSGRGDRARRSPVPPPLTSASLVLFPGSGPPRPGFLAGSPRATANSATSSSTQRSSPARSRSARIVSVPRPLCLRLCPRPRTQSRPASPPPGAGPGDPEGRAGRGTRSSHSLSGPCASRGRPHSSGVSPPGRPLLSSEGTLGAPRPIWALRAAVFDLAASPPSVPATVAVAAPSEFLLARSCGPARSGPSLRPAGP